MSAPSGYTALDFVGFTDKGTYSPIVNYMRNDLVHHGGNIMRCLIDNTKNVTPVVGANWELWVGASANLVERVIAPLENNPADVAFGVGRQIIYDDWLWEVIAPIEVGDALIDYDVDPTNANIKKSAPVETQLLAVKAEADATDNMIAPTEASASSSSAAYSVGDQLILNNILYDVIAAIQIGDALTTGTGGNIEEADTLTDQLKEVDSQIQTLTNNDDAMLNVLGAKNLLPNNVTSQTVSGVTFTVNTDMSSPEYGTIRANGTATDNIYMHIVDNLSFDFDTILSGAVNDRCRLAAHDGSQYYFDTGNGITLPSGNYNYVEIVIFANETLTNAVFKPMIRPASISDDTYVPYAMTNRELTEVKIISTGITNVLARRCGNVVMLRMILTTQTFSRNWNELGTLPIGLRPMLTVDTPVEDNNANTAATANNIPVRITSDGKLSVWAYSDKLTFAPVGNIVFLTNDPMP